MHRNIYCIFGILISIKSCEVSGGMCLLELHV